MASNSAFQSVPGGVANSVTSFSLEQRGVDDGDQGESELIKVLRIGDSRHVQDLLLSGESANSRAKDAKGSTALHIAAALSSPECLLELLKQNDKPSFLPDGSGDTPLHVCARKTSSITPLLLLVSTYGAVRAVNARSNTFFHCLMRNVRIGDDRMLELVKWLFDRDDFIDGKILNAINADGDTAYDIASAAQRGNVNLLQQLLSEGASSGRMLRRNQIVALTITEATARKALAEDGEAVRRTKLFKVFAHYEKKIAHYDKKLSKVVSTESGDRAHCEEKEARYYHHLSEKFRLATEALAAHEAALQRMARILQRVGHGYGARKRVAQLYKEFLAKVPTPVPSPMAMASRCATHEYNSDAVAAPAAAFTPVTAAAEDLAAPVVEDARSPLLVEHLETLKPADVAFTAAAGCSPSAVATVDASVSETPLDQAEVQPPMEAVNMPMESFSITNDQRRMGGRIWRAYAAYRRRREEWAAVKVQTCFRMHWIKANYLYVRAAILTIQRAWRAHSLRTRVARSAAVRVILSALRRADLQNQGKVFIAEATAARQRERIRGITQAVTQLVWRENFCSAFREIVFAEKRHKPPPPPRNQQKQRWWALTAKMEPYVLLVQMIISLFLLIYMGCIPRTGVTDLHNKVDIAFICAQLVLTCLHPLCWWHIADFAIIITALVCAAARAYGGVITITLLLLKFPAAVRAFFPEHSGTRTYCRAIRNTALYLIALSPFAFAGVGATVRGACVNNLLLTSHGNWGRVFLFLWSALAPQYKVQALVVDGVMTVPNMGFPVLNVVPNQYWFRVKEPTEASRTTIDFVEMRMPTVQVVLCTLILFLYLWSSTIVGTHSAIRSHYDISDETKLKANKHRFRNVSKMELLDAHRAANMEALGQQLDGVMWEADVRAAKEAVDASHYDHNTNDIVHRFVRRVQDSVTQGNLKFESKATRLGGQRGQSSAIYGHLLSGGGHESCGDEPAGKGEGKWDCRNEDPRARGTYDIEVIEAALGKQERKGRGERFFERQWTGPVLRRETTLVLVVMLIMASVRPNLFPMEIAFSSVLALELVLSFYFLRVDFIFSHYVRLVVRLFSVVVGFVPTAVPFVAFRALRLMEGWSTIFIPPGLVRWSLLYCLISFVTMWMIAFVAALQFLDQLHTRVALLDNATDMVPPPGVICNTTANCLAISLRELVLPAWTPEHIRPAEEAPLMATLVLFFQLFCIPFFLSIGLHPLLQLSNFIGRFLRLVVQSLHKDVLDYLDSYLEGEPWYFHWRLKIRVPANVIVKLKMWVYDSHRRNFFFESLHSLSSSMSSPFLFPQNTYGDAFANTDRAKEGNPEPACLNEIISRGEFTTFAENEVLDQYTRKLRFRKLRRLTRIPLLHYGNVVVTTASIAFLWVFNTTYSHRHAVTIITIVIHLLCVCTNTIVFPKDITAALTFAGCASLLVAIVMILLPESDYNQYYCFRYISLVLLGQLQVYPFVLVKRFIKTFLFSGVKVVFPVVVIGALAYLAELLRAQIFLATRSLDFGNATFDSNESSVWQPPNASFPDSILLTRCGPVATRGDNDSIFVPPENVTYEVACQRRRRPGVTETVDLFVYYFTQDSYIYYSIYCYWLLPALSVSTCLAYLYWSGANLLDTRRLTIKLIPLLEDPVTRAQFRLDVTYFRYAGNVTLLASLALGCVFSPSTSATSDDLNLFFGFEVGFTVCGLLEAFLGVAFAVHRCERSWASWRYADDHVDNGLIVLSDFFLLVCETVQLLYYSISVPLCAILLMERDDCFIDPDDYATFFITLRFIFLLRIIPRQYALSLMKDIVVIILACTCILIYFIGSASALADLAAATQGRRVTGSQWTAALADLFRHTFTMVTPDTFSSRWLPLNATAAAKLLVSQGTLYRFTETDYEPDRLLFILSTIGKAVLACAAGVGIAIGLVPLRANVVFPLPMKSLHLYDTLSGGLARIVKFGSMTHDDMRLEARRKIQTRKFSRIFTQRGIPSWALPHLLEELNICRPTRQRRFMFALRQLLIYLPISEERQEKVMQYMDMWDSYRNGAPSKPRFSALPVFPPTKEVTAGLFSAVRRPSLPTVGMDWGEMSNPSTPPAARQGNRAPSPAKSTASRNPLEINTSGNVVSGTVTQGSQYVAPLRLVQAIALFELGFPADSSMGSKLWIDFFTVVQKVRAATLLQSLWRMFRVEKAFDADKARTFQDRMMIAILRRSFRKYRVKSSVSFRCHETFGDALLVEHCVFNPGTGHYDLLNRLRGHYSSLSPTTKFVIREDVVSEQTEGAVHDSSVRQYVSQYLQQSHRRRSLSLSASLSKSRMTNVRRVLADADLPSTSTAATKAEVTPRREAKGS